MLIAQISDTHVSSFGQKTLGVAHMETNLELVVDHINQLDPAPDVVILTGDVTDDGRVDQARNAARMLGELVPRLFVIPGNHDDRETLWSEFSRNVCRSNSDDFFNYVVEDYEITLIGLDTTIPNASGGELCDARLSWLEERLSETSNRPTVIFMHHPPVKCGVLETDVDGFVGSDKLGDIVKKHPNIERIICGHVHLPIHLRWQGTIVSTTPSIGMRLNLDLTMTKPSCFFLDCPSYQLHHWTDQKTLITHTIRIGEDDGPYLFEKHG